MCLPAPRASKRLQQAIRERFREQPGISMLRVHDWIRFSACAAIWNQAERGKANFKPTSGRGGLLTFGGGTVPRVSNPFRGPLSQAALAFFGASVAHTTSLISRRPRASATLSGS